VLVAGFRLISERECDLSVSNETDGERFFLDDDAADLSVSHLPNGVGDGIHTSDGHESFPSGVCCDSHIDI
jgi:hypothetical protein